MTGGSASCCGFLPVSHRQSERSCECCHVGSRLLSKTMIANKKTKEKQYTRSESTCLKCHGQTGLQSVGSQRVRHDWMTEQACTSEMYKCTSLVAQSSSPEISARPRGEYCLRAGWPEAGAPWALCWMIPPEVLAFEDRVCGLSAFHSQSPPNSWRRMVPNRGSRGKQEPGRFWFPSDSLHWQDLVEICRKDQKQRPLLNTTQNKASLLRTHESFGAKTSNLLGLQMAKLRTPKRKDLPKVTLFGASTQDPNSEDRAPGLLTGCFCSLSTGQDRKEGWVQQLSSVWLLGAFWLIQLPGRGPPSALSATHEQLS